MAPALCSLATYLYISKDETEFWRLDKQHTAFLIALADLYPCPDLVERALAPRPGETIEMMDLGGLILSNHNSLLITLTPL